MNNIDMVKDKRFQELFHKHFIYENGKFVNNDQNEAASYCYSTFDNNYKDCLHDKMIQEGYVFYTSDESLFFIYDNRFVFCDSESGHWYLGDNIATFSKIIHKDFEIFGGHELIDFANYFNNLKLLFGKMPENEFSLTKEQFDEQYDLN